MTTKTTRLTYLQWCAVASLAGICCSLSHAAGIPGYPEHVEAYDAREVAQLPKYCIHTLTFRARVPGGNNEAEVNRWSSLMGPTFNSMHHYCWGLMHTNRAIYLAPTKQLRDFHLTASISEFNYVLDRATDNFVLLPEILTKKGENLIRLERAPLGVTELERAIAAKPDYWPPYAVLADYFKHSGDVTRARQVLQKGLAAAPDAKALKNRLAALDKATPKTPARGGKQPN